MPGKRVSVAKRTWPAFEELEELAEGGRGSQVLALHNNSQRGWECFFAGDMKRGNRLRTCRDFRPGISNGGGAGF